MTIEELVKKVEADPVVLRKSTVLVITCLHFPKMVSTTNEIFPARLLRTLAANGLLTQADKNHWATTPLAQACTIPPLRSGYKFLYAPYPGARFKLTRGRYDLIGPVFQKMPEYMAKSQYRCPTATQGPLQYAWNTNLSGFDFVMEPQHADTLKDLNHFMEGRRQEIASWLDFYPFKGIILDGSDKNSESVTVVDVGGGLGHGLVDLRGRFPNFQGRLILQDLPKTVQQAGDPKGVFEAMPHNFYDPQPIKGTSRSPFTSSELIHSVLGAKAYYIRQVLHDWPDKECRVILQQLAAAMRRGYSKILLDEFVVPEDRISEFQNSCDLVMMAMSGGMERTKKQWEDLIGSAGLRIEKIWTLNDQTPSVMEVVLA